MPQAPVEVIRLPKELTSYIESGGLVRTSMSEPFGGLCGAIVKRNNGSTIDGGPFCRRAAGWNTPHSGYGRCSHHADNPMDEGLAPWTGPISDEEWEVMTGRPGMMTRTHQATHILNIKRSWDEWLEESIPPEELSAYMSMPTDPVALLDQEIKLNRLMAARIHRWIRTERMAMDMQPTHVGGTSRDLKITQAEIQLLKISTTFARLMEVRARLSEVASAEDKQTWLDDALKGLPDEEFATLSSNPERMLRFLNQGPG